MEMSLLYLKTMKRPKFKVILTRELVEDGAKVPRGYGFAWRDFDANCYVSYPIPFNVLFRGLRRFWHWMVGGFKHSVIDEARLKGIREGYTQAYEKYSIQRMAAEKSAKKK